MPHKECGSAVSRGCEAAPRRVLLAMTAPQKARESTPSMASAHDKILIVDFGSQVTQLIARRVREEGVYSEIVPFQKAEAAFKEMKPKAVILSGGPESVHEEGSPRAPQTDLRFRRARARHLLRPDDHGRPARRRGRGRPPPRVRPRRCRGQGVEQPVRVHLVDGRKASGLDEPWRPHHQNAAGLYASPASRRTRRSR